MTFDIEYTLKNITVWGYTVTFHFGILQKMQLYNNIHYSSNMFVIRFVRLFWANSARSSGPRLTEGESVCNGLSTDPTGPQLRADPRVSWKVFAAGCRPSLSCWKGWLPWQYHRADGKMCALWKTNLQSMWWRTLVQNSSMSDIMKTPKANFFGRGFQIGNVL